MITAEAFRTQYYQRPVAITVAAAVLVSPASAIAHGGGLDSNGGHHDRKRGGYHYHRAPRSVTTRRASPPVVASFAPRTARTTGRTRPRRSPRTSAPIGRQIAEETAPKRERPTAGADAEKAAKLLAYAKRQLAASKRELAVKYLRRVVDELGQTPSADPARLLIEQLIADEPFRIWTDRSGKHSVEAKLTGASDGVVNLKKRNGKTISIALDSLSMEDQRYVKNLYPSV